MYECKHISQHSLAQYNSAAKASQINGAVEFQKIDQQDQFPF